MLINYVNQFFIIYLFCFKSVKQQTIFLQLCLTQSIYIFMFDTINLYIYIINLSIYIFMGQTK